jgi:hypothetical protein
MGVHIKLAVGKIALSSQHSAFSQARVEEVWARVHERLNADG